MKGVRSSACGRVSAAIVGATFLFGAASSFGLQVVEAESDASPPSGVQSPPDQAGPPLPQSDDATQLQSISVTARKQEELLQDVPLTVFAFSPTELRNIAPKTLFDLTLLTPGLNYQEISGGRAGSRIQMRGISGGNTGPSRASVFLDGVFIPGSFNNIPFQFLQRVEAIPGPQSAQFGRSTFAGAVNLVTKAPPRTLSGMVDVSIGTLGEREEYIDIGGPITDRLRGIAYAWHQRFEGDYTSAQGIPLATTLTRAVGGKLEFEATDNLTIEGSAYFSQDQDGASLARWLDPATRTTDPRFKPVIRPDGSTVRRADGSEVLWVSGRLPGVRYDAKQDTRYVNPRATNLPDRRNDLRLSTRISYYMGDGYSLNFTGGYFTERASPGQRGSATSIYKLIDPIDNPSYGLDWSDTHSDLKSAELRFASPEDRRFRYSIGAFYQSLGTPSTGMRYGGNVCLTLCTLDILGEYRVNTTVTPVDTDALARDTSIFGSVSYDFTDDVTLSVEGRYQREYIREENRVTGLKVDGTWNAFLPRLNLQYRVADNLQFYTVYSVGNNPGVFNTSEFLGQPGTGTRLSQRQAEEEKLYNYEVGMKSTWLDNRLMLNASLYHQLWDGMQFPQTYPSTEAGTNFTVIENRGSATIDGFEIESQWTPLAGLNLRGTISFNRGVYQNYCSGNYAALLGISDMAPPNKCVFVNGKKLENSSPRTYSLSADYRRPLSDNWNWFMRGSYQYQSGQYTEEWNDSWSTSATVFTGSIGLDRGPLRIELYCRNCGQESSPIRIGRSTDLRFGANRQDNFAPGYLLRRPRQFGLHVAYGF